MATFPATPVETPPKVFEPRSISFPEDVQEAIADWLHKQIDRLQRKHSNLHGKQLRDWRRIAAAKPLQENKSWPFPNCSNIVHPLASEARDDLAARVLQLIWNTKPVMNFTYFNQTENSDEARRNKKKSTAMMNFIDYVAIQPEELDLYRVENEWFSDSADLGRARACVAPEHRMEAVFTGYDTHAKASEFSEETLYEGPQVLNLRFEDVLVADLDCPLEKNDPIIRRIPGMNKRKIQERAYKGHWKSEATTEILRKPDRHGPSEEKQASDRVQGILEGDSDPEAEWDIYECYFSWYHNRVKFRLIAWYHLHSKTMANCVYNFVPKNQVPILETCLSVKKMGFAQMLKHFQEEVSTAKNQRSDAITWGMLGLNTIDTQLTTIDTNFTITPGMSIPAKKDSFQHYEMANAAIGGLSLQNEQMIIQQAKMRAGVDPAIRGMGAGTTNRKGQYSAMGTLSMMQDGNSRNDHRTSDFRHSHARLIAMIVDFYGFIGVGSKARLAGLSQELLQEAFDDWQGRELKISLRAANASMNKEITKQNLIILNQSVSMYIKEASSQIQACLNPSLPPEYKKWLYSNIIAKTLLMQEIVRQFDISEQPQEFIPEVSWLEKLLGQNQQPQQQPAAGPGGIAPMGQPLQGPGEGGIAPQPGGMDQLMSRPPLPNIKPS